MRALITTILLITWFLAHSQTTYYISSSGNDSNSGTSPSATWRTIPYLQPGATYLLNQGDTFYFHISNIDNPDPSKKILISSYGSGNKPVLSLYKKIKRESWTQQSGNIWKVQLTNPGTFTGFAPTETNVGFIKVDNQIFGRKVTSENELNAQWDFYSDRDYLYVYSTANPSIANASIEVSTNFNGISVSDNMEVSGIEILGAGAHGVSANNRENVTLKNLAIREIGGSFLPGFRTGTVRYGNGIEFLDGSRNCLVENCAVSDVYDVAFTMQGSAVGTHFLNTTFQNNTAFGNEQSFEMWITGWNPGFTNCRFTGNTCNGAGLGWSHSVRPDTIVGVHILTYSWEVTNADILIEQNTFSRAKSGLYFWQAEGSAPGFTSRNNNISLDPGTYIRSTDERYTAANYTDFVNATGKEAGSLFNNVSLSTLPVRLISFTGERQGHKVALAWQTNADEKAKGFEIQRAPVGTGKYEKIGFVDVRQVVAGTGRYVFFDESASAAASYYRLKQVEEDGSPVYSNVIVVAGQSAAASLHVFPNPGTGDLKVEIFATGEGIADLSVYSYTGAKVLQHAVSLKPGMNYKTINITILPKGYYIMRQSKSGQAELSCNFVKQ